MTNNEEPRSLTDADIEAIADTVVTKVGEVILLELGKLIWGAVRKLVIAGAVAMFAFDQLKGLLK